MKILNKFIKISGLAAICGLFGLGCLINKEDQTNTFEVNADFYINSISGVVNTSYDNKSGSSTSLSYDYDIDVSLGYIENLGQRYIYNVLITFNSGSANNFSYSILDTNNNPYSFSFSFDTLVSNDLIPSTLHINFDITGGVNNLIGGGIYGGEYYFSFTTYTLSGTSPLGSSVSDTHRAQYKLFNSNNNLLTSANTINTSVALPNPVTSESQQYVDAYNSGFNQGFESGQTSGYSNGYSVGYSDGVDSQQQNITDSYNNGYSAGYNEGFSTDSTATTIFSGILQVALVPINFFLAIFNFDILGINLAAFIKALFTIGITIIVIKAVMGGKGASED